MLSADKFHSSNIDQIDPFTGLVRIRCVDKRPLCDACEITRVLLDDETQRGDNFLAKKLGKNQRRGCIKRFPMT